MARRIIFGVVLTLLSIACYFGNVPSAKDVFSKLPVEIESGYKLANMKNNNLGWTLISPTKCCDKDGIRYSNFTISYIKFIGWNKDFIVIEENEQAVMGNEKVWQLIVVKTEQVYECTDSLEITNACNSYDEFLAIREQLGVPDNIEMRDVEEVYEELSKR